MRVAPLDANHFVDTFDCGQEHLNGYLRHHALTNQRRGLGASYILTDNAASEQVLGYYTLSPAQIDTVDLPKKIARGLPRYPIPAIRLSRLAIDRSCQGSGLGGVLLTHAMKKAAGLSKEIGGHLILVDCIDSAVVSFYQKFGFASLPNRDLTLYVPMKIAARIGEFALQL